MMQELTVSDRTETVTYFPSVNGLLMVIIGGVRQKKNSPGGGFVLSYGNELNLHQRCMGSSSDPKTDLYYPSETVNWVQKSLLRCPWARHWTCVNILLLQQRHKFDCCFVLLIPFSLVFPFSLCSCLFSMLVSCCAMSRWVTFTQTHTYKMWNTMWKITWLVYLLSWVISRWISEWLSLRHHKCVCVCVRVCVWERGHPNGRKISLHTPTQNQTIPYSHSHSHTQTHSHTHTHTLNLHTCI